MKTLKHSLTAALLSASLAGCASAPEQPAEKTSKDPQVIVPKGCFRASADFPALGIEKGEILCPSND